MREQVAADDRQRVIHALVRAEADLEAAGAHLETEELAALVSGTLFKTECARIENHLLACPRCAELAQRIQKDFEAGVVPILLRRAVGRGESRGARLTPRWIPWLLGILAAALVMILSARSFFQWGGAQRRAERAMLVYHSVGTPFYRESPDHRESWPLEPAAWLDASSVLELGAGDLFEALDRQGRTWRVTSEESVILDEGDDCSRSLAREAWAARRSLAARAAVDLAKTPRRGRRLKVIHPRGRIFDLRPRLRWTTTRTMRRFYVSVHDVDHGNRLFQKEVRGHSLPWPDDLLPLRPGGRYRIEIRVKSFDGTVDDQCVFTVLAGKERRELDRRLVALAAQVGRGPSILRTELYRQMGLHAECREELERLRISETENVSLLMRLKVALQELELMDEAARIGRLIEKRRQARIR